MMPPLGRPLRQGQKNQSLSWTSALAIPVKATLLFPQMPHFRTSTKLPAHCSHMPERLTIEQRTLCEARILVPAGEGREGDTLLGAQCAGGSKENQGQGFHNLGHIPRYTALACVAVQNIASKCGMPKPNVPPPELEARSVPGCLSTF